MFDDPPPWIMVPEMDPDDPDAHSIGEAYILIDWLRSWQSVPREQQAAYLARWQAPPAWQRAIVERSDHDPVDLDIQALEPLREQTGEPLASARMSWWRRLLRPDSW